MSMQSRPRPHDGVAAEADIAPTAPTPPTRASVAAPASSLLLMDIMFPSWKPQPYPAHGCCYRPFRLATASALWPDQDRNGWPDRRANERGRPRANPEVIAALQTLVLRLDQGLSSLIPLERRGKWILG